MSTYDRAALSYDRVGPDLFSHFGKRIVALAGLSEEERLLDVACGTGAILLPAARASRALTVGIDLSAPMLGRARRRAEREGLLNVCLAQMSATALAFPAETFDALFSGFALAEFAEPHAALCEFRRVLRPRGAVALTVAERWWWEGDPRWAWHESLLEALGISVSREPRLLSSPDDLAEALQAAALVVDHVAAERFELSFSDFDEWWRWAWSHGYRRILERLSPSKLARYRASCEHHLGDGSIQGALEVLLSAAHRPAS